MSTRLLCAIFSSLAQLLTQVVQSNRTFSFEGKVSKEKYWQSLWEQDVWGSNSGSISGTEYTNEVIK